MCLRNQIANRSTLVAVGARVLCGRLARLWPRVGGTNVPAGSTGFGGQRWPCSVAVVVGVPGCDGTGGPHVTAIGSTGWSFEGGGWCVMPIRRL